MDIDYVLQTFDQIEDTITKLKAAKYNCGSSDLLYTWIHECKQRYVAYGKEGDAQHIELVFYVCIVFDLVKTEEKSRHIPPHIRELWDDFKKCLPYFLKHLAYPKTTTLPEGVLHIVRKYLSTHQV